MIANDDEPPTEQVLARVSIGDETDFLIVGQLLRAEGKFWVERIAGPRRPHSSFELAMADLDQLKLAYAGRLEVVA